MKIDLHGIVVIVGNYGSGKTEVAINLSVHLRSEISDIKIADLDLVNPYFRTREAKKQLSKLGIDLVLPEDKYLQADLPILSPAVSGMIRKPGSLAIIDMGGDDVGATVLGALADSLEGKTVRMLQVVNLFRPGTDTVEGCLQIRKDIEAASGMTINGIVGNSNLIDETTPDDICRGYDFVRRLAKECALPLEFITSDIDIIPQLDMGGFECPVLPIKRQLVPPWRRAVNIDG